MYVDEWHSRMRFVFVKIELKIFIQRIEYFIKEVTMWEG